MTGDFYPDEHEHPEERAQRIAKAMPEPFGEPSRGDFMVATLLTLKPVLWHTRTGAAFATIVQSDGTERHFGIGSDEFDGVMIQAFGEANPVWIAGPDGGSLQAPTHTESTLRSARTALKALALKGPLRVPMRRVASAGSDIWIDLGDETHQVLHITKKGVQIAEQAPMPLLRTRTMLPLPRPRRSAGNVAGDVCSLFDLDGDAFQALVCLCLDALRSGGGHAVGLIIGPEGAGKLTLARFIQRVIDPSSGGLQFLTANERDFAAQIEDTRLLMIRDLGGASEAQQGWLDAFVRAGTGGAGGIAADGTPRDGVAVVTATTWPFSRVGLADRTLAIEMVSPLARRLSPRALDDKLRQVDGRFLAYLLAGAAKGLSRLERVAATLPRAAASAAWCAACAPGFGWTSEDVLDMFRCQAARARRRAAATDPVASAVHGLMVSSKLWRWPDEAVVTPAGGVGSVAALHAALTTRVAQYDRRWPKLAADFGQALRRAEPVLEAVGIEVDWASDGLQLSLKRRLTSPATLD